MAKSRTREHILFSNYFWENDEEGKDKYDYAREYLFEEYGEDEEWATEDDVPDNRVTDEVYAQSEFDWDDFKVAPCGCFWLLRKNSAILAQSY